MHGVWDITMQGPGQGCVMHSQPTRLQVLQVKSVVRQLCTASTSVVQAVVNRTLCLSIGPYTLKALMLCCALSSRGRVS